MFERACSVLVEKNIDSKCFDMQICVYRDYDCGLNDILQVSSWENRPEDLRNFLTKIVARGGDDIPEAIEIGLQHAYKEHEKSSLSQIILIADAPAKSLEEVKRDRSKLGDSKWNDKFGTVTFYGDEVKKFTSHEVPVPINTFYIDDICKKNFEDIAKLSSGVSKELKLKGEEGSEILTNFISEAILSSVGKSKSNNADDLIKLYKEKYPKFYTKE
jgi:hypothetical protein